MTSYIPKTITFTYVTVSLIKISQTLNMSSGKSTRKHPLTIKWEYFPINIPCNCKTYEWPTGSKNQNQKNSYKYTNNNHYTCHWIWLSLSFIANHVKNIFGPSIEVFEPLSSRIVPYLIPKSNRWSQSCQRWHWWNSRFGLNLRLFLWSKSVWYRDNLFVHRCPSW